MEFKKLTLSVVMAAAMIFGPAALEVTTSIDLGASAFAKGGNGGGASGGNGGGNGKSGKGGSVASSDAKGGDSWGNGKDKGLGNNRGSIASKLGALNAAHASANARLHASDNSRVGLIAAYEEQVQLAINYQETTDDRDQLAGLQFEDPESRSDLETLEALAAKYDVEFDETDPDRTVENILSLIEDVQTTYETTAIDQAYEEVRLLSLAANKPLSLEVVKEVNELLGLEYENVDINQDLIDQFESGEASDS